MRMIALGKKTSIVMFPAALIAQLSSEAKSLTSDPNDVVWIGLGGEMEGYWKFVYHQNFVEKDFVPIRTPNK